MGVDFAAHDREFFLQFVAHVSIRRNPGHRSSIWAPIGTPGLPTRSRLRSNLAIRRLIRFGFLLFFGLDDLFQTSQLLAVVERNQRHALRRTPSSRISLTRVRIRTPPVVISMISSSSCTRRAPTTLPLRSLGGDGDDALRATTGMAEIGEHGALAETVLGPPPAPSAGDCRRPATTAPVGLRRSSCHAHRAPYGPWHRTSSSSNQTALPAFRNKDNVLRTVGDLGADQEIALRRAPRR